MNYSFQLLDEPWIPVSNIENKRSADLSLLDLFEKANDLKEIVHSSPLVVSSLHRFLLAVIYSALGYPTETSWIALWKTGNFPMEKIKKYLNFHRKCFDLFDQETPFYQVATYNSSKPSSPQRLIHELASGNNAVIFDHNYDSKAVVLSPADGALYLIASQGWAVGGGKTGDGYPNATNGPLMSGAMSLVQGDTLFKTLLLNYVGKSAFNGWPEIGDQPAWEQKGITPVNGKESPKGYKDYLTWQTRTIKLHAEEINNKVVVSKVSYAQGREFSPKAMLFDPGLTYKKSKKEGWYSVKINESKAGWRDSGALLNLSAIDDTTKRPEVLQWLAQIAEDADLLNSERLALRVFGLCNDKAKIFLWRQDSLPLPIKLLNNKDRVECIKMALQKAEEVGEILSKALFQFIRNIKAPNSKSDIKLSAPVTASIRSAVDSLQATDRFWSSLDVLFLKFVNDIGSEKDNSLLKIHLEDWVNKTIIPCAKKTYAQVTSAYDFNSSCLKAQINGEASLWGGLRRMTHPLTEALNAN
jgi:CRISPR system Cascade subunit CasA